MSEILNKLSDAFAQCMEVNNDGEPVLLIERLPEALELSGIASSLAPILGEKMDPDITGFIDFETFVNIAIEALAGKQKRDPARRIFRLLADKSPNITIESLQSANKKLKFGTPRTDLQAMIRIANGGHEGEYVSRNDFQSLWERLNNVLGPEVGAEIMDLPRTEPQKSKQNEN